MKWYFSYIRVSTVRQGEKGSSLQEQRAAIESYSRRNNLSIAQWFVEMETAAAQGRPQFSRMLKALAKGKISGVIIHKIDRSARNLRDWATLGDLHDQGIELHFVHESLDFNSRGGRLSADIQAVVAADYIRNLREEIRKGFYGRLKQGLYPLPAPVGYLDRGGGVPKSIDPVQGPIVLQAFTLYATGRWSLDALREELQRRGLKARGGRNPSRNGLAHILHNVFYIGLIRIKRSQEVYQGVHQPLIDKDLFERVHSVLDGKSPHKMRTHTFRYQRLVRCSSCNRSLAASRHKGHVYYRCQTKTCPLTSFREETLDRALNTALSVFNLSDTELEHVATDVAAMLHNRQSDMPAELQNLELSLAAVDDRTSRLTDAYVDHVIDRETFLVRKERLLLDRTALLSRKAAVEAGDPDKEAEAKRVLELIKTLKNIDILEFGENFRESFKSAISNFSVCGKNLAIAWQNPLQQIANCVTVTCGGPHRIKPRTGRAHDVAKIIIQHCETLQKGDGDDAELPKLAA